MTKKQWLIEANSHLASFMQMVSYEPEHGALTQATFHLFI